MLAAAAIGLTGACANQSPPPGGPEDRRPPVVVRTEPDTFGEMTDLGGSVRFQFDERISENVSDGDLSSAVTVSPLTGEVHVSHGRSSLEVSLDGGFRPGLVYRVTLQPVVSDMFGNRLRDAFELVFTTGGRLGPTGTLAGEVWDRVSGRGVSGATVYAVGADSLVNVARADNSGVFAFRYLPAGDFTVTAFQDNNRDTEVSPREPRGTTLESVAEGDTILVDIPVLEPDTTPAVAGGVSALDSVTIVVQFDDYLDPDTPLDDVDVTVTREDGASPVVTRIFQESGYDRYVQEVTDSFARLDSIDRAEQAATAAAAVPDSVAADSVSAGVPDSTGAAPAGAPAPSAPVRRGPPRLERASAARESTPGRTPPGRRLVGILDGPLREGEYQVHVDSVVNLNGLAGGGGDVTLAYEPPPPPADTTSQGGDDDDDVPADADDRAPNGADPDAAAPDADSTGPNP